MNDRLAIVALLFTATCCLANKDSCVIVVTPKGSGSGTIVGSDANGAYVLTNKHVVSDAERASWVVYKGKRIPAKFIKQHGNADMALVQAKLDGFAIAEIADELAKAVWQLDNKNSVNPAKEVRVLTAKETR